MLGPIPRKCGASAARSWRRSWCRAVCMSSMPCLEQPQPEKSGGRPPSPSMPETQEIEAGLLGFLRREVFAPTVTVTEETDLVAAGFDSVSLVRLLLFVENTYGFWIPEAEITTTALSNVRALAATVSRLLHAG